MQIAASMSVNDILRLAKIVQRRDAELLPAVTASEPLTSGHVMVQRAAVRAYRLAVGLRPPEPLERLKRLVLATGIDRLEAEGPGGCAKEEVLCHLSSFPVLVH